MLELDTAILFFSFFRLTLRCILDDRELKEGGHMNDLSELRPEISIRKLILEKGWGALIEEKLRDDVSYKQIVPYVEQELRRLNGFEVKVRSKTLKRYQMSYRKKIRESQSTESATVAVPPKEVIAIPSKELVSPQPLIDTDDSESYREATHPDTHTAHLKARFGLGGEGL